MISSSEVFAPGREFCRVEKVCLILPVLETHPKQPYILLNIIL